VRPRLALAFVTLVLLAMGARLVTGPEERVAFTFYDDAYYYLGVAKHLAAGEGSTFDGINGTNGYHPLWCWLLVPIVALTHDPGTGVRAVAALWFALAAAVPWVVFWAARRRFGDRMAATVAVIFTTLPWLSLSLARPNGLETPLLAILVCLVLGTAERVVAHVDVPSSGASVGLGALAGLATLTRLDAGFLAVAVAIATARRSYAKALLVDWTTLASMQAAEDIIGAEEIFKNAAAIDVRPLLWKVRSEMDLPDPVDPVRGFRESGYTEKAAAERIGGGQSQLGT